ncbi:hypothetical protein Q2298_08460 [Rhodococcus electrodiphilus]|uniref:tetratricopeptide repeat protein n=1 Tax=Rhodococcus ruber TaxID=1830 RepID=UPI0026F4681B|nr:hypothetical protein [Rhodococcus ruber]MDO2378384.1 hypothetical protein [Rhodococcus ruber]
MDTTENIPAAKNILVYYGVGGIGKTTLSERLEKWSNGDLLTTDPWGPPPPTSITATCRIDLHRTQGRVDMVAALVSLRRAFGKVKKRWPAFDFAFAAYWSAIKPGEPLPGSGTNDSIVAEGIADSISGIFSEIGIPGAGITTRTIRMAVNDIRSRVARRRLFERYEGFEELLDRCSDLPTPDDPHPEIIGDIASLLDTDLCFWPQPQPPLIVAFIDTFERLLSDPRRTDEKALNELVWRMPNVLFVVTGRNPIDWYDDSRTNIYVPGRTAWPGLVPGATEEPRQHLVGKLALEDRLRIIYRGREIYAIDISDAVAHELALASDGLPQYLDLALDLALNRKANGGAPISVDDVTGSLNELVLRVLEDVPPDEQRALRAASMFPFFDSFIVAKAAQLDDGCARRALARPMIDPRGSRTFPHSMHDAIRLAIRSSDHSIPNGWSDADWREAGERGMGAVRERYEAAATAKDTEMALEALALAIALVAEQDLTIGPASARGYDDWLSEAIVFGPSIAGLRTTLPARVTTAMGRGIVDFVTSKTTEVTVDEAAELLTGVFESSHPLRLPAGRHRGYVLRNAGRWDEAIAAFNDLVTEAPTPLHGYQRVLTFVTARRFAQAVDESRELAAARAESIRATCSMSHGVFDGYLDRQGQKLATLWERRRQREALEKEANIVRWQALLDGEINPADLETLRRKAETAKHATALRDEYLARLLCDPANLIANADERAWIENVDRSRNSGNIGFRTGLIRLAVALYSQDEAGLIQLADAIRLRQQPRSRLWIPVECVLESYGYAINIPPTQWLDPYAVVRDRWRGHFDVWLERTRT